MAAELSFLGRGVPAVARSGLLKNKAWFAGNWRAAQSGDTYAVYNPSNRELIAEVSDVSAGDVEEAVHSAYLSQRSWAALTAKERSNLLRRWCDLMVENKNDLAKVISLENGKPLKEAVTEVLYGASYLEWFAEEGRRVYGDIIPTTASGRKLFITKQPLGVAALVTPFNFPVAMVTRKVGAALAAGCTTVVKPSDETPFSALALAELADRAGIPAGVFNVLPASRSATPAVTKALTGSHLVAKLSFTGSTAVGKLLMADCADTLKKLSLELGGNAPLLVFNSADLNVAVRGTVATKFRNTGQTCICANRIFVQSGIHDAFVDKLSSAVSQLRLGDPFQDGTEQGPLINEPAVQKVERHVSDAVARGAKVIVGGERDRSLGDSFYKPSVVSGANCDMLLATEETFGPVAPVIKFEEEAAAIAMANATPYGLAGYVFTSDISQIWRVSDQLECGVIGVNEGNISSEVAPFGGVKQSGFGREGSKYGIDDYLTLKYICMGNLQEQP